MLLGRKKGSWTYLCLAISILIVETRCLEQLRNTSTSIILKAATPSTNNHRNMLESAIPTHLRKERTCPVSTPPNYEPPFPAYCARLQPRTKDLALAIIGAQYASPSDFTDAGISTVKTFMTDAPTASRPSSWEVASVTDKRGAYNIAVFAYWPSISLQKKWEVDSGFKSWWNSSDRESDGQGWFREILRPSVDRFETVMSSTTPEGAATMNDIISGEIEEHAYWGSMRDRMPAAQNDTLPGEKQDIAAEKLSSNTPTRLRIPGRKNLCIILSGQDWSDTLPAERTLYLSTMHPVLVRGMNFLRDEGRQLGCYANDLWDVVDSDTYTANLDKTFGLGFFNDMKSLEYWSKSHQTHLNIFGGFLAYAKKLNNVLSLRVYHEVYVLDEDQQDFEYVRCHDETAMLGCLCA